MNDNDDDDDGDVDVDVDVDYYYHISSLTAAISTLSLTRSKETRTSHLNSIQFNVTTHTFIYMKQLTRITSHLFMQSPLVV